MQLLTYDETKEAVLNPNDIYNKINDCPKTVVTCFSHNLINYIITTYDATIIGYINTANGKRSFYKIYVNGKVLGVVMSYVGASIAVAAYEDLYAMGVENIVVFGTCGVLDATIDDCLIIIPSSAIRDEGTSFHYAKPGNIIETNANVLTSMMDFFTSKGFVYTVGRCWTTDGVYRETTNKVRQAKKAGAICVDMECSAFAALAQFRNKSIAQFFYAADNLDAEKWDSRSLSNEANVDIKTKIVDVAVTLAIYLHE